MKKPLRSTHTEDSLPKTVTLDNTSPDFDKKKSELQEKGYKWDRHNKNWRLPDN